MLFVRPFRIAPRLVAGGSRRSQMKKAITLTVALLSLSASLALAQGINLYVGDCSAGATTFALTNACTTNTGSVGAIVGSCVLPSSVPDFVGAAAIVDIQTDQATIPNWC